MATMDLAAYSFGCVEASWRKTGASVAPYDPKSATWEKGCVSSRWGCAAVVRFQRPALAAGMAFPRCDDVPAHSLTVEACTATRQQPHLPTALHISCAHSPARRPTMNL